MKDNLLEERWESIFPIMLGSLAYNTMINAFVVGSDLLNFNLGFYQRRINFNNKKSPALAGLFAFTVAKC